MVLKLVAVVYQLAVWVWQSAAVLLASVGWLEAALA